MLRLRFQVIDELSFQISSTNVVLLKGMEQVWRVILNAPDKQLALEATHFLIRMYLEVCYPR